MNPIASLLTAAAADLCLQREALFYGGPLGLDRVTEAALEVVVLGMREAGFQYRRGALVDPLAGPYYEGCAGISYLVQREGL